MSVLHINDLNEFNEKIKDNMTVVVFSAGFCKPCKEIYPYIEKKAEIHTNITFVKVDIVEGSEISEKYDIKQLPSNKYK